MNNGRKATPLEGKKAQLKHLEDMLPYADGPAYGQDQQRIAVLKRDIRRMESEAVAEALPPSPD